MSKKRYVDTKFWDDPWVVDSLNPLDRYLYLYFLTNGLTNVSGVYEISLRTISNETGIEKEEVLRMLKRLENKVVYQDGWIVLRNAIKNQNYHNDNIKAGIEHALEKCPNSLLQYLQLPKDWIPLVVKRDTGNLQMRLNDSSKSYNDSSKLYDFDSDFDLDSDYDSDLDVSSHAAHATNQKQVFKKTKGLDKKAYAKAVRADEALEKKETEAKGRKPSGNTQSLSEVFSKRLTEKN